MPTPSQQAASAAQTPPTPPPKPPPTPHCCPRKGNEAPERTMLHQKGRWSPRKDDAAPERAEHTCNKHALGSKVNRNP